MLVCDRLTDGDKTTHPQQQHVFWINLKISCWNINSMCTCPTGQWATFFWWPSPASRECLWLPGPESHRCPHQRLSEQEERPMSTALAEVLPLKLPTSSPCICTRNSVLILRVASLSFSLLEPHKESISSMKMMDGLFSRANENKFFTNLRGEVEHKVVKNMKVYQCVGFKVKCHITKRVYFSLSPSHLDTRSEEEMEKKVELLASVATALAR